MTPLFFSVLSSPCHPLMSSAINPPPIPPPRVVPFQPLPCESHAATVSHQSPLALPANTSPPHHQCTTLSINPFPSPTAACRRIHKTIEKEIEGALASICTLSSTARRADKVRRDAPARLSTVGQISMPTVRLELGLHRCHCG